MKKLITLIIIAVLGFYAGKITGKVVLGKQDRLPDRLKAGMPKNSINSGLQVIIKGIVQTEMNSANQSPEMILRSDMGGTFVLFNPPYLNALLMNKTSGKTIKIKGLYISQTKYKGYPGVYIQDILELY